MEKQEQFRNIEQVLLSTSPKERAEIISTLVGIILLTKVLDKKPEVQ